ncbi:transporter substrate-binding domain-containing protein [bacterium]|nr:transporter substrate-binding domain-containing protein [bacterium]
MLNKRSLLLLLVLLAIPIAALAELQPLKVICDPWPPYQIVKDQQVGGFTTTVVETLFRRMRIRNDKIAAYPWKRAITMIEEGKADALFSATPKDRRTDFARYPDEPLVSSLWVMWVREGSGLHFRSLDDLEGKRLGVVNGYLLFPGIIKEPYYPHASEKVISFINRSFLNIGLVQQPDKIVARFALTIYPYSLASIAV